VLTKSSSKTIVASGARPMMIGDEPNGIAVPVSAPSTITSCVDVFLARRVGRGLGRFDDLAGVRGFASRGACKSRRKTETTVRTNHQRAIKKPIRKMLSNSSDMASSLTHVGKSNVSNFYD
jgi:hypothetical protein